MVFGFYGAWRLLLFERRYRRLPPSTRRYVVPRGVNAGDVYVGTVRWVHPFMNDVQLRRALRLVLISWFLMKMSAVRGTGRIRIRPIYDSDNDEWLNCEPPFLGGRIDCRPDAFPE